jgi:hypothetical protein
MPCLLHPLWLTAHGGSMMLSIHSSSFPINKAQTYYKKHMQFWSLIF